MKHLIVAMVLATATWQLAFAAPCWDLYDTCGSIPLCNPNPPSNPLYEENCFHVFCDDANTCPFDSEKKKMLEVTRVKYKTSSNPDVFCVGTQHLNYFNKCCYCNQPGVTFSPPE